MSAVARRGVVGADPAWPSWSRSANTHCCAAEINTPSGSSRREANVLQGPGESRGRLAEDRAAASRLKTADSAAGIEVTSLNW
jgi:hypothetical protein